MCENFVVGTLVYAGQQDEAGGTEQYKAKKLSEPEELTERLAVGDRGNSVKSHGLLDHPGVGADAAR